MFIFFNVLYFAFYFPLFLENKLSIDGKKQELKKKENNNIGEIDEKRDRKAN